MLPPQSAISSLSIDDLKHPGFHPLMLRFAYVLDAATVVTCPAIAIPSEEKLIVMRSWSILPNS
jgi:hypothetical protein